jgi:CSLREA domain-containing protein
MTAALTATANNGNGQADPGDTINYTVTLNNTSGSDGTGLSFNPALDSHTTFVPGSIKSTPICFDQSGINLNEDSSTAITLTGQDPDGDSITFSIVTPPANGGFGATTAPNLTYTPNANFFGSDSFTFRVNDGTTSGAGNNGNSNETCTVSITVNGVNDAPTFTVPGNPTAVNEDAGAQSVASFITGVRPAQSGNTTEDAQTVSFVITNNTNPGLFSSAPALNVVGGAYPKTATLTYTPAANQNGTATITYHAHDTGGTANSGVDNSADQTFTITVNAVNDPPVVVSPTSVTPFAVQANMKRTGLTGLLGNVNDNADNGVNGCVSTTFTVTNVSATTPAGGTISNLNTSTGTFDFDPPPGVTGTVTFTYTVTDTGCPGPGVASAPVTVTFNVAAPVIWFVNTTLGPAGNGTLNTPFNTLAAATAAMGLNANQRIFVFGASTTLAGTTVTLQGNNSQASQPLAQVQAQWLIGQGAIAADFDTLFGIAPPAGTIARPVINGTRPTIQGTVTMKENTVVQGLNINVSAGGTKGLTAPSLAGGVSTSLLTIRDVNVTSAGGNAVDISSTSGTSSIIYTTSNSSTSPNILSSSGATALSVVNTTIGSAGLTFRSITSGSGSNSAGNGIILDTTGSSGGLTVVGTGSAGSGGTIQHKTGADGSTTQGSGIYLNSTSNVSLDRMQLNDFQNSAIRGNNVTGFSLTNTIINGTNGTTAAGGSEEGAVRFDNLLGSALISNCTLGGTGASDSSFSDDLRVINSSGTLTRLSIANTSFGKISTGGNNGLTFTGLTTATMNLTVTGSTFTNAIGSLASITANNNSTMDLVFRNNAFSNNNVNQSSGGGGLVIQGGSGAHNVTYDVSNNTFKDAIGIALLVATGTGGVEWTGTLSGNTIGIIDATPGTAPLTGSTQASGIKVKATGTGRHTTLISGNTVHETNEEGIFIQANDGSATLNASVFGNTVDRPGPFSFAGLNVDVGALAGDTNVANVIIGSSSLASAKNDFSTGDPFNFSDVNFSTIGGAVINLSKAGSASGTAAGVIDDDNLNPATTNTSVVGTLNLITANTVRLIESPKSVLEDGTTNLSYTFLRYGDTASAQTVNFSVGGTATFGTDYTQSGAATFTTTTGTVTFPAGSGVATVMIDPSVDATVESDETIILTLTAGAGYTVATPSTATSTIRTDDTTPPPIALFDHRYDGQSGATGVASLKSDRSASLLVLLNTDADFGLALESFGHVVQPKQALSVNNRFQQSSSLTVPSAHLEERGRDTVQVTGVNSRRSDVRLNHATTKAGVQASGRAHHESNQKLETGKFRRSAFTSAPVVGGTFPINGTGSGFSLPNGKSITIKFSVTLNNPPNLSGVPPATPQVSAQGTLSGAFPGNPIVTDDPGTGAANDATVTLVDLFDTTTTLGAVPAAGSWNVGQSITFTATVASNPPGNPTAVTGSVIFKDNGTPIAGCNGVALSSAQAQCVTTFGSGAHSVTAVYSGDGNFDPSTSTALSQGAVNQSGTSTAVTSSLNPSLVTENVTFTATVTSTSGFAGPPTGTVQFKDNLVNLGSPQTLNGSGVATLMTSALAAGNHPITAVYSGDSNFTTSTGTLTGDPQVVNKSNTTTLLTSSSNPVAPTVEVTYTATVSSSTSVTGPPTGTVTFKDGGVDIVCEAGSQALTGGVATCKFTYPDTVGSPHDITAVYGGDATFNGNTSNHVSEVVQSCSASVIVTSNADSGANTLREAIDTGVCAGGTITFDPGVTSITLVTELTIAKNMTINGPGAGSLTISGNNVTRVFEIAATKTATISGMTITGGKVSGTAGAAGSGAAGGAANGGGVLNGGTLTLTNVIVSGNHVTGGDGGSATGSAGGAGGDARGGGIFSSGTLTLTNTTVNGNNSATGGKGGDSDTTNGDGGAGFGGGVYSLGTLTLTLTNSTISGNTATGGAAGAGSGAAGTAGASSGGGIYNDGTTAAATATITNSTISGNTAGQNGGGIFSIGTGGVANLTITGSTISGNTAGLNGGGIYNTGTGTNAPLTITNSTISGNGANNDGGGIFNDSGTSTSTLTSVTVTGNTTDKDDAGGGAGGGLNIVSGTFTLKNTIVAGNLKGTTTPTAHDITGTINTAGSASSYNLIGDAASSGGLTDGTDHNIVGNAGVGTIDIATVLNTTLADNGGPTKTHALVGGSPALEKGNAFGLTTDQRGFPRPVDFDATPPVAPFDDTDIGAFESQIAPNAPGAPDLDAVSDSGANSTDNKTNVTTNLSFTIPGVTSGATVQLFRDGAPVASGVAAGASIQLTDPGPLTFDADGTDYSYTAKQAFGVDISVASSALVVTVTIIPDAPVLDPASDSGTLGDNITNDTSPTFNITNVVNTATVKLFRDGVEVASGAAAGTTIQLTDPSVPNGTFSYTAKQIFNAVTSDPSAGTSITITIKPSAPDLDAASDSGASSTDNYTNDATPTFTITGVINGANVELLRDGTSVANGTAVGASIQLTDPGATAALHTYRARQTVGITLSPDSDPLDVTIDTSIAQPSTPDLITADDSNINNDDVTSKTTPTFTGTAEANSSVQLFANAVLKGTSTADNSGNWSITSSALADGSYNITAVATDLAGNVSLASSALPVVIDTTKPTVAMSSAVGDPTATTPIPVTVTFSESVTGFTIGDIVPGNGTVGNFAGGPAVYTFDLTPTSPGPVSADIAAGVAIDLAGNTNTAATQFNRTFDPSALSVTITPVSPDPRNTSVSSIQIVFNKAVTGFDLADLTLKLNGGANLLTGAQTLTSGDNITWTLGNLSGLTGAAGTYVLKLTASGSGIQDAATNPLTSDATESWVTDTTAPDVTINQAAGQTDPVTGPTATTVINFTAIFTEPIVIGSFTNTDVAITGTAGATVVNITEIAPNDGTHFNVAIEGMTQSGTVIADIPAGAAQDSAGNGNTVGTFTDHTVTYFKDDFTTFEVNSVADTDDGPCAPIGTGNGCTLREAINAANADAGAETITFNSVVFAAPGPYTINLTGALADLSSDMTINGPGAKVLTVRRNTGGSYRIFTIPSGNNNVTIDGLTISNGNVVGAPNDLGGGILNQGTGTVNVTNSTISGNTALDGGGIVHSGPGTLNVTNSTISGNTATVAGGIRLETSGPGNITNSTISGNTATGDGGGILVTSTTLTITNSTITNNRADNDNNASGTGGGIFRSSGTVTLRNTIVAGNFNDASPSTTADDIDGTVDAASSFNLIGNGGAGGLVNGTNSNQVGVVDPGLFPLADNGGPTFTHALQCTSPAIDKGKAFGSTTDQRGGVRPFDLADGIYPNAAGGDGSDIGAFETQTGGGCQPVAVPPNPQPSTNEDTPVIITLTGTYTQNFPLTFTITQQPAHAPALTPTAPNCVFTLSMTCTSTVSYAPNSNFNGLDSFKFKVSASGLDSDEADVFVTVNPVNDPPVANPQSVVTDEDTPVGIFLTGSDVDSASLTFIIVTPPAHGSLNPGGTGQNQTYTPTANYNGPDSFTFKINDGSADSNTATVSITVNAVNDAPELDNLGNMSLSAIDEDVPAASNNGTTVTSIIASAGGDRITDVDAGAVEGLAVIAVDNTNGTWQFSIDSGVNWTPFGNPNSLNARLLSANAATRVRFLPNADFNGNVDPGLTFRAWDQTSGANGNTADASIVGGTTAFSIATETASITVNAVNDAPVMDNTGNMSLDAINEDVPAASNNGTLVSGIIASAGGDRITDIDAGAVEGIAVIATNNANGTWQYSLDNGANWSQFGIVDSLNARLLAANANTRVRFSPNLNFNGTVDPGLTFRAWDQTSGFNGGTADVTLNGGTNAFSTATETASITVNPVNDAPSFTKGPDQIVNEDASAQSVASWATNFSVGPPDEAGQTVAFQVTGNTNPGLFSAGPAISSTGTLTYTPATNVNGSASITIVLKDNGGTANGGQDTSTPQTFTITVNAVNDAPVNHVPGAQNIPLNAAFVFSAGTSNAIFISDVDAGSDAVQVTLKATDGTLSLNGTSGLSFTTGDGTDDPLMTFTGSLANINAALEGMKNLAFGSGVIEITTNDLGHNGVGGPLSDTDTIQVTVVDNLAPVLLTIPGSDRAIAFSSPIMVTDPFSLQGNNNFSADHRTRIMLFALHAQLRPGEDASAVTAEADVAGTVVPLIVESVTTVPNFDWLTQLVVKFPDGFSTGGGGPHDAKIRIRLRGQNSNQAVIIIVPAP